MGLNTGAVCIYLGSERSLRNRDVCMDNFDINQKVIVIGKDPDLFDIYDNRRDKGFYIVLYKNHGGRYVKGFVKGNRLKQVAHIKGGRLR